MIPMLWTLITSFKGRLDFNLNPFGLPSEWRFSNYSKSFEVFYVQILSDDGPRKVYMVELFINTILYSVGSTLVSVFTRCISAYVVAKYNFRFKQVLYSTVIITMILPIIGSTPSTLQLMRTLGLYDNLWGIIFMGGGFTGMTFLIFYATFKSISWEYAEAAFIDGASHAKVMFNIMIPLARITVLVMMLIGFIDHWNNYTMPLVYMPNTPTIAYGLYYFQFNNINAVSGVPYLMAACMLVTIPIFIIFMIFRNRIMGNVSLGGLKG